MKNPSSRDHTKLCHKRWKETGVKALHLIARHPRAGPGQLYVAKNGEKAHYESALVDVVKSVGKYQGAMKLYLYLEHENYKAESFLVINDQEFLHPFVKCVNWTANHAAVASKSSSGRKCDETGSRQKVGNFANYGLCCARNNNPNAQWIQELVEQGLCGPAMHTGLQEDNQKNKFQVLSDLLRSIDYLRWLKNRGGTYARPAKYFDDDTWAARMFHEDNLFHAHRAAFADQCDYSKAELCECHGDPNNSKKEGRDMVLSLTYYQTNHVHDCLIGYMQDAHEKAEERIVPYSKFNKCVLKKYKKYEPHQKQLTEGTLKNAVKYKDSNLGMEMLMAKPNLNNLGYIQPIIHITLSLTTVFSLNTLQQLGLVLAWLKQPETAYHYCSAGPLMLLMPSVPMGLNLRIG